jgi:hypothetical protein
MPSRTFRLAPLALALLASPAPASAADDPDPDREACLRHASLHAVDDCGAVEVVDARGRPIADAKVTWSDDKATSEMIQRNPIATWFWWGNTNVRGRVVDDGGRGVEKGGSSGPTARWWNVARSD